WMLPVALLAMLVEIAVVGLLLGRPPGSAPLPGSLSRTDGLNGGPDRIPVAESTSSTVPAPTALAAARPPEPTVTPMPAPTATTIAKPAAPPQPASATSGPAEVAVHLYHLVEEGEFDHAAELWMPPMQAQVPPCATNR